MEVQGGRYDAQASLVHVEGTPADAGGGASGPGERAWLVFLGTRQAARAPWIATSTESHGFLEAGLSWPAGVRVVGHLVDPNAAMVYVRVETLAVMGQPAGLRGVVPVRFRSGFTPYVIDDETVSLRLSGARDEAELRARLGEAPIPHENDESEQKARSTLFKNAGGSAAALDAAAAPEGIDLRSSWQGRFLDTRAHFNPGELSRSPNVARVLEIVRGASSVCELGFCPSTAGGYVAIRRDRHIEAVIDSHPRGLAVDRTPGPTIAASAPTNESRAVAHQMISSFDALSEVPWGDAGGALTLLSLPARGSRPRTLAILTREGPYARIQELFTGSSVPGDPPPRVAFADVDGDGRADVIVQAPIPRQGYDAIRVFLSPHDVQSASARTIAPDLVSAVALRGVTRLEDGVVAATRAPRRLFDEAAARAAIMQGAVAKNARTLVAESVDGDVRFLDEEALAKTLPLLPACLPAFRLRTLSCSTERPVCQAACRTEEGGTGQPGSTRTYVLSAATGRVEVTVMVVSE